MKASLSGPIHSQKAAISAEHAVLLERIEIAIEDLRHDPGPSLLRSMLEHLAEAATRYFDHEEAFMAATNYPLAGRHANAHRGMLRGLQWIASLHADSPKTPEMVEALAQYLAAWRAAHLRQEDGDFDRYLVPIEEAAATRMQTH
jgi:hemerythrin-like metal-binding protein